MTPRLATRPVRALLALALTALAVLASGCGSDPGGQTVVVAGVFVGPDADAFQQVLDTFQQQTGIHVIYNGSRALDQLLKSDVDSGTTPDVAVVASPTELQGFYQQGQLTDLDQVLDPAQQHFSDQWLDLVRYHGKQFGVVLKADLKSIVFYTTTRVHGVLTTVPPTFQQLTSLPGTPWCLGLGANASSGFPGTDWIEELMLKMYGPTAYDDWVRGRLPWTSPQVRSAFTTFGTILAGVRGGPGSALETNFGDAGRPMFGPAATCTLDSEGSYIAGSYRLLPQHPAAGVDYDFFAFPAADPVNANDYEVAANVAGLFHDTPAARQLINYLSSAQAQAQWVKQGAFSADAAVPESLYPDDLHRKIAQILTNGTALYFDGSDLMPDAVSSAFQQAVLSYAAHPADQARLTGLLTQLQQIHQQQLTGG